LEFVVLWCWPYFSTVILWTRHCSDAKPGDMQYLCYFTCGVRWKKVLRSCDFRSNKSTNPGQNISYNNAIFLSLTHISLYPDLPCCVENHFLKLKFSLCYVNKEGNIVLGGGRGREGWWVSKEIKLR